MSLQTLQLKTFRSYLDSEFELSSGVNIVVGPNASGKSNILEALFVLCRGLSWRSQLSTLIHDQAAQSLIGCFVDGTERQVKITSQDNTTKRNLIIEGVTRNKWMQQDSLPVVLFEPEILNIVTGSPTRRRTYIDEIGGYIDPRYQQTLQRYERLLRQRNKLLKRPNISTKDLFVWDVQFIDYAHRIVSARLKVTNMLNEHIETAYNNIAATNSSLRVEYSSGDDTTYQSQLLRSLHEKLETDKLRGYTSSGPHRDDLNIILNHQPAITHASRGESRSIILALKLTELAIQADNFQQRPLVLLDDVFSELDKDRQRALSHALSGNQTVITTTNADLWVQFDHHNFEMIRLGS